MREAKKLVVSNNCLISPDMAKKKSQPSQRLSYINVRGVPILCSGWVSSRSMMVVMKVPKSECPTKKAHVLCESNKINEVHIDVINQYTLVN